MFNRPIKWFKHDQIPSLTLTETLNSKNINLLNKTKKLQSSMNLAKCDFWSTDCLTNVWMLGHAQIGTSSMLEWSLDSWNKGVKVWLSWCFENFWSMKVSKVNWLWEVYRSMMNAWTSSMGHLWSVWKMFRLLGSLIKDLDFSWLGLNEKLSCYKGNSKVLCSWA